MLLAMLNARNIREEANVSLFGHVPTSPLKAASRIFGAVAISLALLLGIAARMRSATEPTASMSSNPLVNPRINGQDVWLIGQSGNASD